MSEFAALADRLAPPDEDEAQGEEQRAKRDAHTFIDRFCWVIPAGGGEPIPFRLWDFQRGVLNDFRREENVVVLKARQLGLSWLALAYGLWLANCHPFQTVLILNRNLGAGIELLQRVRFMHSGRTSGEMKVPAGPGLPGGLRSEEVQYTEDPKMPLLRFGNGSRIISLPSTEDTGTGLTAQLIIADEVSKWKWPEDTFTAILAVIAGGGTIVAISTAKGTGNYFHRLWMDSQPGAEEPNDYYPIFIPSSAHPYRDDEWLRKESKKYPDLRKFRQEHPETPQEAFQLADEAVFEEFDRNVHHAPFERGAQWPMWRGIDFGFHFSPAYWIEVQGSRVAHVCAELDQRASTTEELAQQIVGMDARLGVETTSTPAGVDPAGKARTSQSGTMSDHVTLYKHGIHQLKFLDSTMAGCTPADRVDLIKVLLREERLKVDCNACPRLAEAFEQAQWETKRGPQGNDIRGETYAKDGYHEHFLDALGYALINIWPPGGPATGVKGAPVARYSRRRYGPSEFS